MKYTDLISVFAIMGVLAGTASVAISLFSGSPISLIAYGVTFTLAGIVWGFYWSAWIYKQLLIYVFQNRVVLGQNGINFDSF